MLNPTPSVLARPFAISNFHPDRFLSPQNQDTLKNSLRILFPILAESFHNFRSHFLCPNLGNLNPTTINSATTDSTTVTENVALSDDAYASITCSLYTGSR